MSPLISVIMPVYNGENFLHPAIKSILEQSYQNLELIIIDDSKHNECKKIAEGFSDPRVRYLKGSGEGIVSALNYGVFQAQGAYIARMDADDISLPERLSVQLRYLQESDRQFCGSWMSLFGKANRIARYPESQDDIMFFILITCPFAHPTVFGEAEIFKKNPYNTNCDTSEDFELWARLAQQGIKMGNIAAPLLKYRAHSSQISALKEKKITSDSQFVSKQFAKEYLPKNQFDALGHLGFGMKQHYSKLEIVQLVELLSEIAKDKAITRVSFSMILPVFWRKIVPMNPLVFWDYLKAVKKFDMKFWSLETLNICIQSFLCLKKNSAIFQKLRVFGRS
jgi:glycosyltransferase involved in cell wall biosynthesis